MTQREREREREREVREVDSIEKERRRLTVDVANR